jgi:hypothetical protein
MNVNIEKIISELKLQPHPEGGYFRETYRSKGEIDADSLSEKYTGSRNYSTCIYFMLTSEKFSAFHRIRQDEIWHFYDGSPILLHMISPEGNYTYQKIGINFEQKEVPQFIVPGGTWFAAEVMKKESFSLIGCTVSPGFSFDDFELKSRGELTSLFPKHNAIIERLTHA